MKNMLAANLTSKIVLSKYQRLLIPFFQKTLIEIEKEPNKKIDQAVKVKTTATRKANKMKVDTVLDRVG